METQPLSSYIVHIDLFVNLNFIKESQVCKGSFPSSVVAHVSKRRSSQEESNSSHEDRCWKKIIPRSYKSGDTDLAVDKIHDSVDSPSRTLSVFIKESQMVEEHYHKKGRRRVARSALHDKDMEAARKELSITTGERLSHVMLEEHEKIEKVSSIHQSLS
ncbi:hypothetical protein HAX54_053254 [Datura stramonium]|uniref:Uncharacterized protein n=1 Tax=Datura stramonium TaxID=4076 RepID=A0ABS8T2C6_DATST|nr:hypothetical protein [Datura stramonium]